jgi:hypothetical protein
MSKSNWSGLGEKRFDFSAFKSAGKTEYLIAGVLGVIILGAAYLTIRQFMGDTGPIGPITLMYKCDPNGTPKGCGHEFPKKVSDLMKELPPARDPSDEAMTLKINCPKCGAKSSCWQERQCPNPACKKWYIPNSTRAHYEALRSGRGDPMNVRDYCPWCKIDIQKWYIDHAPK